MHARVPLAGQLQTRDGTASKDQRFKNCVVELINNPVSQQNDMFIRKRPGLTSFQAQTAGEGRGISSFNGSLYYVIGNTLYKDATSIATLATSTGKVGWVEVTGNQLFLADGSNGYVISGSTATIISDADFPSPHIPRPIFLDGYVFLQHATNSNIYNSDLNTPTSWTALGFINPSAYQDAGIGIARLNNNILAFGTQSIEYFYDAANATGSPLSAMPESQINYGCAASNSICVNEMMAVFVAQDREGNAFVAQIKGYDKQAISTPAIDLLLNKEGSNLSSAYAVMFKQDGHLLYVLTLTGQNITIVFDHQTGYWYEFSTSTNAFVGKWHAFLNDVHYFLGTTTGKVYKFETTAYTDDGTSIDVLIQTSKIDAGSSNRKFMSWLELVGDRSTVTSNVGISYSDDDYQNWSSVRTVDLSAPRFYIKRLGSFRRRAFRFTHTDSTPLRLEAFDIEFTVGVH